MSIEDKKEFQTAYWQLQLKNESLHKNFISDRSLIDILAYNLDFLTWKDVIMLLEKCTNRYDILFYFPIEFELVKDGIRNPDPKYQKIIDDRIQKLLIRFKTLSSSTSIINVSGSINNRINTVQTYIM